MASIISASIDLNKIDKSKIIPGKNGAKYYNITISVNDDVDQYNNNVQITEPQTKEQRQAKEKRTFLGNGRVNWTSGEVKKSEPQSTAKATSSEPESDLPF